MRALVYGLIGFFLSLFFLISFPSFYEDFFIIAVICICTTMAACTGAIVNATKKIIKNTLQLFAEYFFYSLFIEERLLPSSPSGLVLKYSSPFLE